jgi:hypothetical protein
MSEGTPGSLYRPSNGTEGAFFMAQFCDRCFFDSAWKAAQKYPCQILSDGLLFDIADPDYPEEWVYGPDGQPVCTAFEEEG